MALRVRVKEGEKLTPANIERVYNLVNSDSPIKWQDACDILNIAKNKARLTKILENYKEEQERASKFRAEKRGKPATKFEIQECIQGILQGDSLAEIAERLYRSASFVKNIAASIGIPGRFSEVIPDNCMSDDFSPGEIVYIYADPKHDSYAGLAEIERQEKPGYYSFSSLERIEEPSPYFPQYLKGHVYKSSHRGTYSYNIAKLEHLVSEYSIDPKRCV